MTKYYYINTRKIIQRERRKYRKEMLAKFSIKTPYVGMPRIIFEDRDDWKLPKLGLQKYKFVECSMCAFWDKRLLCIASADDQCCQYHNYITPWEGAIRIGIKEIEENHHKFMNVVLDVLIRKGDLCNDVAGIIRSMIGEHL